MEGEKLNGMTKRKPRSLPTTALKEAAGKDKPYAGGTEHTQVECCILCQSVEAEGNHRRTKAS